VFHRALSKRATYDVIKHFCVASTSVSKHKVCPSTKCVAVAAANKFVDNIYCGYFENACMLS